MFRTKPLAAGVIQSMAQNGPSIDGDERSREGLQKQPLNQKLLSTNDEGRADDGVLEGSG